jgi:hypothetical protein
VFSHRTLDHLHCVLAVCCLHLLRARWKRVCMHTQKPCLSFFVFVPFAGRSRLELTYQALFLSCGFCTMCLYSRGCDNCCSKRHAGPFFFFWSRSVLLVILQLRLWLDKPQATVGRSSNDVPTLPPKGKQNDSRKREGKTGLTLVAASKHFLIVSAL